MFDGRARLSFAPSAAPPCPASAYLARGFFLGSREAWPLSRVFLENLSFFTLKRSRTAIPTADGRSRSCRQMASRGCLSRLNWASGLTHQRQPTIIGIVSESMISPCRHRRAAATQSAPSATPSLGVAPLWELDSASCLLDCRAFRLARTPSSELWKRLWPSNRSAKATGSARSRGSAGGENLRRAAGVDVNRSLRLTALIVPSE